MKIRFVLMLCVAGVLARAEPARAISCTISAVGVSFGTYNVFSATPLDSTGSITYVCTGIKPSDRITINLSTGGAATYAPRQMRKTGDSLNYNLYLDAARTSIWGDATSGTSRYGPIKPISSDTLTIFGRIPASQDASAGSYTDTAVVTINF